MSIIFSRVNLQYDLNPLRQNKFVRSLRDLIKARFARFGHHSIDDRGTDERSTWCKSNQ